MKTLRQWWIAAALCASAGAAQAGCNFSWQHFGKPQMHDLIAAGLGTQVPDAFCPHANSVDIVVMTDVFVDRDGCFGYATAGLSRKGTQQMPKQRFTGLFRNAQCRSEDMAQQLARDAALGAVGAVMRNLDQSLSGL